MYITDASTQPDEAAKIKLFIIISALDNHLSFNISFKRISG